MKDIKTESDVEEPAEPEDVLDIMLDNKNKRNRTMSSSQMRMKL